MDNLYRHFLSIFLIQCFMVGFTMSMTVTNLTTDQSTLLEFKDQILDPHNVLASNWTTSSSVCHWVGISCSHRHGRVTVLDLSGMGLEGSLAPHLGNLSFLVSLNLSGNNFQGNLPNELAKLRRLKLIDFSDNALNAKIPKWFGNLTTLQEIYLRGNSLKGEIPREIGNLFALEIFAVQNMSLVGSVPASIFNISSLKEMYLTDNFLEGEIPWEIGNLIKMEIFEAKDMHLSGQIPPSIFNISSLKVISLNNNFLSEYGSAGIVSAKSDVYSYGILLMETFTRKKPTNEMFVGEMSMKNWVKESLSNETIGVADYSLLQNVDEQFTAKANCISAIMRLALECSAELPEERKDMKDVVSVLKRIKTKYLNNVKQA